MRDDSKLTSSPDTFLEIPAAGVMLHALERNRSGAPAVLFLHGWLDHAHSFDFVRELLPTTWRSIALDFRGHGRSGYVLGGLYHFTDYLADVEATLDLLGLEEVHLVGHSLGGSVALFYAAARPDRVLSVTAVDSLGPTGGEPARSAEKLKQFVSDLHKPPRKRRFPDVAAAAARLRQNNPGLTEKAAEHLARFGTEPIEGGVEFTFDPAHRRAFGMVFDEAQTLEILSEVRCPVRVIRANRGHPFDEDQMRERLAVLRVGEPVVIDGGHHVHLEAPERVAEAIRTFLEPVRAE